jgi:hypothetical protein
VKFISEIFTFIRDDLYNYGIDFGSYESKVFSIRLIGIILKQYSTVQSVIIGKRLSKKTDAKLNENFRNFLANENIWNLSSIKIFIHLFNSSQDIDNSDVSGIANHLLIEYFVKTLVVDEIDLQVPFIDWINVKVAKSFKLSDIESYHENIGFFVMKTEYLFLKDPSKLTQEVNLLINMIENISTKLKLTKDVVELMENGENIFIICDCINYVLQKMVIQDFECVSKLAATMKSVTYQYLELINDKNTPANFDELDKKISQLLHQSIISYESNGEEANLKHKTLIMMFITFRSLSNLSESLAKIIISSSIKCNDDQFKSIMQLCVEINVQMLTRFCHRGAIEVASQSLGVITKIISNEFSQELNRNSLRAKNLQEMLDVLECEIDCGKRAFSSTGEIRSLRGLLLMSHHLTKNHLPFLKLIMSQLLLKSEQKKDYQFVENVQPIHLHLIAILVKDSDIVDEMLQYHDCILVSTFKKFKETKDFVMQNALLQIVGNMNPKISNFKRHNIDEESESFSFEPKAISIYEFHRKMPNSYEMAFKDLQSNDGSLSQTFIIILLEILSNYEYRKPFSNWDESDKSTIFIRYLSDPCEKIRNLAAKCYGQWHLPENLPATIANYTETIFNSSNSNLSHGSLILVRHMIQRYESSVKFVEKYNDEDFLRNVRSHIISIVGDDNQNCINRNLYLRYHLLDFLLFIGFKFTDIVVTKLVSEEDFVINIGYTLFADKVRRHQN